MKKYYKKVNNALLEVSFYYKECSGGVIKTFSTAINGKRSNITGLKKYLQKYETAPSILGAITCGWRSLCTEDRRKQKEARFYNDVSQYFLSEGFAPLN